jgi:hypothetical protein
MPTYQLLMNLGSGLLDYSASLYAEPGSYLIPFTRSRLLHNQLKATSNTAKFSLNQSAGIIQQLLQTRNAPVQMKVNGQPFFSGFVLPKYSVTNDKLRVMKTDIECVDHWYYMQWQLATAPISYFGWEISNPAQKVYSLLHQLFYAAGFQDSELNLPAIPATVTAFAMQIGDHFKDVIEGLIYESGYIPSIDAAGVVQLYPMSPQTLTPSVTLKTGVNLVSANDGADGVTMTALEYPYEGVDVTYSDADLLPGSTIFQDVTGQTGSLSCSIPVSAGCYYPSNASASVDAYATYQMQNYKIIAVQGTPTLALETTGDIQLQKFIPDTLRANLKLYSSNGGVITKLSIIGDAIVEGDQHTYSHYFIANTLRVLQYTMSYVRGATMADTLSQAIANWLQQGAIQYKIKTAVALTPGDIVTLDETLSGVNQIARVLQADDGKSLEYSEYVLEGMAPLTLAAPNLSRLVQYIPPPSPPNVVQLSTISATMTIDCGVYDGSAPLDVLDCGVYSESDPGIFQAPDAMIDCGIFG